MTTTKRFACALGVLALGSLISVHANEARADLEVHARLARVALGRVAHGPAATGVATIEVTVEARNAISDLELQAAGRALGRPDWADVQGRRVDPGREGVVLPARGALRTTIDVPLEGAAIHEISVSVTGVSTDGPLSAKSTVRVALGVPDGQPVDDGTYAHFPVKGNN